MGPSKSSAYCAAHSTFFLWTISLVRSRRRLSTAATSIMPEPSRTVAVKDGASFSAADGLSLSDASTAARYGKSGRGQK